MHCIHLVIAICRVHCSWLNPPNMCLCVDLHCTCKPSKLLESFSIAYHCWNYVICNVLDTLLTMCLMLSSWWPWIIHRIFTMAQEFLSLQLCCNWLWLSSPLVCGWVSIISMCVYVSAYQCMCVYVSAYQRVCVCMTTNYLPLDEVQKLWWQHSSYSQWESHSQSQQQGLFLAVATSHVPE